VFLNAMPRLPETSTIRDTAAFAHWAEAASAYIEQIETGMLHRVALEQREPIPSPRIRQTVLEPATFPGSFQDYRFFPMESPGEPTHHLFFAQLAESEIVQLCRRIHSYRNAGGESIPVRFRRFQGYFGHERQLATHLGRVDPVFNKQLHLPSLRFPFLPYTRKFLELVTEAGRPLPGPIYLHHVQLIDRPAGLKDRLVQGYVPVWNVVTSTKFLQHVDPQPDQRWTWQPLPNDFESEVPVIIHEVRKRNAPPLPPGTVRFADGRRIESNYAFDEIVYSEILEVPRVLPGAFDACPVVGAHIGEAVDLHWHRLFLQSMQLTRSDLYALLSMIPEVAGRFSIDRLSIEPATRDALDRRFTDYLWYHERGLTADDSGASLPGTEQVLRIALKPWPHNETERDFLEEDRVHYFASICSLFLPFWMRVEGVLVE
jgi:hypothetical protein